MWWQIFHGYDWNQKKILLPTKGVDGRGLDCARWDINSTLPYHAGTLPASPKDDATSTATILTSSSTGISTAAAAMTSGQNHHLGTLTTTKTLSMAASAAQRQCLLAVTKKTFQNSHQGVQQRRFTAGILVATNTTPKPSSPPLSSLPLSLSTTMGSDDTTTDTTTLMTICQTTTADTALPPEYQEP
ncbi:hypothetical protein ACA910_002772 [Epithemia clementina (nom. ined.)]